MTLPTLIAVAHGTRQQRGLDEVAALVARVRTLRPEVPVRLCWLDIAMPSLADELARTSGPAVVVPLLLSTGYHVTRDIPQVVGDRADVAVGHHLGPDDKVVRAVVDRLRQARVRSGRGPLPTGPVALIAAGSSEPAARDELAVAGSRLRELVGHPVVIGQLTAPDPFEGASDIVEAANYMLASGHFSDRLVAEAPCDVVAQPLSDHPLIAELVWDRYDDACGRLV